MQHHDDQSVRRNRMKIAITAEDETMESRVDQRFGRCRYFLIADTESQGFLQAVKNEGAIQGHGAGIKAAQQLGELGVKAVLTGDVGPNAADVLKQLGIKAYNASETAKESVRRFRNNELKAIAEPIEPRTGDESRQIKEGREDMPWHANEERIFFPLLDDNGMDSRISPHFGHAPFFGLFDTKTGEFTITGNTLRHDDPGKSPVDQIIDAVNPTSVFSQGIGARAVMLFNKRGISLKTGPYENVRDAVGNLDKLAEQTSDCGHAHHHGHD
jgi:predicted Fe-Mo cluster-binding NifX family protein